MSYFGAIVQNVLVPLGNDSTSNLAAGATFTGTGVTTLGVAGIQVSLKTDQNCLVYVDQSPDNTNWDITDTFNYYSSLGNFSSTVQAVDSYTRARVKNNGYSTTTYFRFQMALCPIVEAVPRSVTNTGYLKTSIQETVNELGDSVLLTPYREFQVEEPTKLVGSGFYGTTLDPNFWSSAVTNGGTVTQIGGYASVRTNTSANATASMSSALNSRYIPGHSNRFRSQIINDAGFANNVRTWGIDNGTDGAYFKLDGTIFGIATKNTNVETAIASGSFNGKLGSTYVLDTSNHSYDIVYTNGRASFYVDNVLLQYVSSATDRYAANLNLPIKFNNSNSNGSSTDVQLKVATASIARLGKLSVQPRYKYQSGTTAGVVCKYGAGNLHGMIITGVVNNAVVTLYDSTTASGSIITSTGALDSAADLSFDFKSVAFSNGLTLVIATQNANVTILYE